MPSPVLFDAVTLLHFACVGRLNLLAARYGHRTLPRWAEAVHDEIVRGQPVAGPECAAILGAVWLGEPAKPAASDRRGIQRLWVGLNEGREPPIEHAGEAESIYFAEKLGGVFATDDNAAYDFAERRLGVGRAIDTVLILREAVAMDEITAGEAVDVASSIRAAGRHLRRHHPPVLTPDYFG